MLEQSNLEEAPGEFLPFMQGMMQSLLSKEVLYPSLKDLVEKYPQWLEEKKDTLSSEDFTRYSKQLELMEKVKGNFSLALFKVFFKNIFYNCNKNNNYLNFQKRFVRNLKLKKRTTLMK